jgi:hypothetical protein
VSAAKITNLTMEQSRMIYDKFHESGRKTTQKQLGEWAKLHFKMDKPPTQGTISNILNKKRPLERHFRKEICSSKGNESLNILPRMERLLNGFFSVSNAEWR